MGNTFGHLFRVTTYGESHGPAVGVVVDGCPSLLPVDVQMIQLELDRRRPGQSALTSQRREPDSVEILSGVHEGLSLGTPIHLMVRNVDARERDYEEIRTKYRPSHADFTYAQKFGIRAWQGGGRSSARETVGRVAAGAIAKAILAQLGVEVIAWVQSVGAIGSTVVVDEVNREMIDETPVRCPDPMAAQRMIERIEEVRKSGDSVGGVVAGCARGVPAGWGEPVFDKLEADLAKAILSIPACKGFESGDGFAGTLLLGSEHNDAFRADSDRKVTTPTNRSGGIQGGISNGQPITFQAAFKPTATILHEQATVTTDHENTTLKGRGRHDPCVLPRAVPVVESMVALVLADHALRHQRTKPQRA